MTASLKRPSHAPVQCACRRRWMMVAAARLLTGTHSRTQQRVVAITNGRGPGLVAADAVREQNSRSRR